MSTVSYGVTRLVYAVASIWHAIAGFALSERPCATKRPVYTSSSGRLKRRSAAWDQRRGAGCRGDVRPGYTGDASRDSAPDGPDGRLCAVGDADLSKNVLDVFLDRLGTDEQ